MGALVFRSLLLAGLMVSFLSAHIPTIRAEEQTAHANKITIAIPVSYFSAFSSYTNYKDQPVLSWPAANDQAGKIGGWRFYAREAQQPDVEGTHREPGATAAKPPAGPAANSHQHHEHGSKP